MKTYITLPLTMRESDTIYALMNTELMKPGPVSLSGINHMRRVRTIFHRIQKLSCDKEMGVTPAKAKRL